jgi:hypothetical protein
MRTGLLKEFGDLAQTRSAGVIDCFVIVLINRLFVRSICKQDLDTFGLIEASGHHEWCESLCGAFGIHVSTGFD